MSSSSAGPTGGVWPGFEHWTHSTIGGDWTIENTCDSMAKNPQMHT